MSLTPAEFAYFYFHSFLRTAALKKVATLGTGAELGLGAAAGALAQIFTIPVAVVATRQQLWNPPKGATGKAAQEPSLMQTARSIVSEGGVTALWTGLKPGLVLTVNPAITYGVFERGKGILLANREGAGNGKLGVAEAFWLGCLSKTLATVVTYPYIFAKVRLQGHTPDDVDGHVPKGALEILKDVYHEQGIKGWYQGLSAQIIKAVLCQGEYPVCGGASASWASHRIVSPIILISSCVCARSAASPAFRVRGQRCSG